MKPTVVIPTPGSRIAAFLSIDTGKGEAEFLGFGTYVGDGIPPIAGGTLPEYLRGLLQTNPKFVLDNGDEVWGYECWWGSEEEMKKQMANWTITEVSIQEARERAKKYAEEDEEDDLDAWPKDHQKKGDFWS